MGLFQNNFVNKPNMAKSIRSKARRQARNIKRQHYAKKDLEKLKQLAAKSAELQKENVVTMIPAEEVKEQIAMEVDRKSYNKKTKLDEDGKYPKWMNQRQIEKQKVKNSELKNISRKANRNLGKRKLGRK